MMLKPFKNTLTMATLSLAVGLVGCGGSDSDNNTTANTTSSANSNNSISNGSNSNNLNSNVTLKYTRFDKDYDGNSELDNIIRNDYTINNSGVVYIAKGLLKSYQTPNSGGTNYEIGDNYFEQSKDYDVSFAKNVKVSKPTADTYLISYETFSQNNQKTTRTQTFKEVDISGEFDFAKKEATNFVTWTNNSAFPKLPNVVNFPTGSSCFIAEKETQDRVTYGFDESYVTGYTNLDNFLLNEDQVEPSSIKKTNVGINNQWQVVEYQQTNNTNKSYAVFYNGKVYEHAYKNELEHLSNTDTSKGEVDCDQLNQTAGDYMEQQLIQAYK